MHICMDWRSVDFDWNRARAFLVTAEEGSLSAAARALGMAQPTLGRQVTALEEELGVALFERGARGLELTPTGTELVEHVRAMGDAATRLSLSASGQSQSIEGSICVTATEVVAAYVLPPIVRELRLEHPGIEVEIIASNETSDLTRREADIAIRAFRPTQQDLIAKRIGDMDVYLYASSAYLDTLGDPSKPEDLADATFIGVDRTDRYPAALRELGLPVTRRNFAIITGSHLAHWELVKHGAGIGVMPAIIGDAEPKVQRALPELPSMPVEGWLVAHRELRSSRRVRTVFDFLAERLTPPAQ